MADAHVSVHLEGVDNSLFDFSGGRREARREMERMLAGAASYAEVQMKAFAPGSIRQLTSTSDVRWIDALELEAVAGVEPAVGRGDIDPRFPLYVHEGTGLYRLHSPSYIRPQRARAMRFEKRGEGPKFRRRVSGQRAQPFVYMAYQMTTLYMRARVATMRIFGQL
jgi:hypothetical protein